MPRPVDSRHFQIAMQLIEESAASVLHDCRIEDVEDAKQNVAIRCIKILNKFDPRKGDLIHYLRHCIKKRMLTELQRITGRKPMRSVDRVPEDAKELARRDINSMDHLAADLIERPHAHLTKTKAKTFKAFIESPSIEAMADRLNIPRHAADDRLYRLRIDLRELAAA